MAKGGENSIEGILVYLPVLVVGGLFLPGVIGYRLLKTHRAFFQSSRAKSLLISGLVLVLVSILGIWFVKTHAKQNSRIENFNFLLGSLWLFSAGIFLLSHRFWLRFSQDLSIQVSDLNADLKIENPKCNYDGASYIGKSLKSFGDVYLTEYDRCMHTLISGSTGSGKTTLLKALFIDALEKNHPVLIVDPKGNNKTVAEFQKLAADFGRGEDDFLLFSLINPENSCSYNPLKSGSALQIRDRLMGALSWSEQFYKNQASHFLISVIEIIKAVGLEVTLRTLYRTMTESGYCEEIESKIKLLPNETYQKKLLTQFKAARKIDRSDLINLESQLRDFLSLELENLLNPSEGPKTIDLFSAIESRKIIYFQLNTMAYELIAPAIGKLLLQDLKSLASQVHGGMLTLSPKFVPIFIDEFGSFAFQGFIDFLKMSRDVGFANHLLFQSMADLDLVSPQFKAQVQQNCITKIILRLDDPDEVDFFSSVAGTYDSLQFSHQIEKSGPFQIKTGMGNSRMSKQMRIEHDVFKRLRIGQAVLIQKAPAREDLIQIWNPKFDI